MYRANSGYMASEKREPVGRKGAFSFVHNDYFYVSHGDPAWDRKGYSEDELLPLQRFSFSSAQWSGVSPASVDQEPEEQKYWTKLTRDSGVCCAVLDDCAYTFGGRWKFSYAVHELNLKTMVWRRLEPQNREDGPLKDKHEGGMVACGDEALCIFGGYGIGTGRHQLGAAYHSDDDYYIDLDGCWTNELHVFHIKKGLR